MQRGNLSAHSCSTPKTRFYRGALSSHRGLSVASGGTYQWDEATSFCKEIRYFPMLRTSSRKDMLTNSRVAQRGTEHPIKEGLEWEAPPRRRNEV